MQVTFKVYRKEPGKDAKPAYSNHTVELDGDTTVMDGLLKIRDEQDATLAFRAACMRGYCGECMIRANGKTCTSCTSKVSSFTQKSPEVTVDPIRQSAMADIRKTMSCYYCGLCDEGCTVLPVDFDFIGPAALMKANRLIYDPRDTITRERFKLAEGPRGLWDCVHCFEASEHCPRCAIRRSKWVSRMTARRGIITVLPSPSRRADGSMRAGSRSNRQDSRI